MSMGAYAKIRFCAVCGLINICVYIYSLTGQHIYQDDLFTCSALPTCPGYRLISLTKSNILCKRPPYQSSDFATEVKLKVDFHLFAIAIASY